MSRRIPLAVVLLLTSIFATAAEGPFPEAVVRELYQQVTTLKPLGIPKGANRAAIWRFLSRRLTNELETAQACEDDYFRKYPEQDKKPEFRWLEAGIFSGENEEATPTHATVVGSEARGNHFLVLVQLTYEDTFVTHEPAIPFRWPVTAVVVSEEGRFAVDDVLLSDPVANRTSVSLSSLFTGCDGSRWTGGQ